jgi:hypothetical protein
MPRLTLPPAGTGFSREAAVYLANACDLAYSDAPGDAAAAVLGLDAVTFRHDPSDTQGFVGRGDGFAVLAFRGSERIDQHPKDWLTNFDAVQVRQDPFTGEVHAGFSRALTAAWVSVDAVLRTALAAAAQVAADAPGLSLYVTGHSLGGALATLAACRLAAGQLPAAGASPAVRFGFPATYTFGAPRVGNAAFCAAYLKPPTYRVVNSLDIVPLVPLAGTEVLRYRGLLPHFIPQGIRDILDRAAGAPVYGDVGTLVYLDDAGNVTEGGDRPDWAQGYLHQAIRSLRRSLNAPVTDHFINSYLRALGG